MGEKVVMRQNSRFQTLFWATDPYDAESQELESVSDIHFLTPYGMLLVGLGSCTTIVLHTYAQAHGVALDEVELRLEYARDFRKDCDECEEEQEFEESIEMEIVLEGDLSPRDVKRLLKASEYCPIHKMLDKGIEVRTRLAEAAETEGMGHGHHAQQD